MALALAGFIPGLGDVGKHADKLDEVTEVLSAVNKGLGGQALDLLKGLGSEGLELLKTWGSQGVDLLKKLGRQGLDLLKGLGSRGMELLKGLGDRGLELLAAGGAGALGFLKGIGDEGLAALRNLSRESIAALSELGNKGVELINRLGDKAAGLLKGLSLREIEDLAEAAAKNPTEFEMLVNAYGKRVVPLLTENLGEASQQAGQVLMERLAANQELIEGYLLYKRTRDVSRLLPLYQDILADGGEEAVSALVDAGLTPDIVKSLGVALQPGAEVMTRPRPFLGSLLDGLLPQKGLEVEEVTKISLADLMGEYADQYDDAAKVFDTGIRQGKGVAGYYPSGLMLSDIDLADYIPGNSNVPLDEFKRIFNNEYFKSLNVPPSLAETLPPTIEPEMGEAYRQAIRSFIGHGPQTEGWAIPHVFEKLTRESSRYQGILNEHTPWLRKTTELVFDGSPTHLEHLQKLSEQGRFNSDLLQVLRDDNLVKQVRTWPRDGGDVSWLQDLVEIEEEKSLSKEELARSFMELMARVVGSRR